MQPNNDDRQTELERPWREQDSSAGQATRRLPGLSVGDTAPLLHQPVAARNNLLALALIAVGVLLMVGRLFSGVDLEAGLFFLTIASGFLFFAFWRRIYGLLIPGCIIAGFSFGVTFAELTSGVFFFWGLALGFLSIYLLGQALFNVRNPWPIYPAVPLFGVGLIIAITQLSSFFAVANTLALLPLLLIGAGLYLGWGRRGAY